MMPPNQSSVALFSSCLQSFPASESPQTKKREVISMTACWLIPPFLVMGSLPHFCTKSLKGFFAEPFKVTLELVFYVQTQFSLRSLKKLAQLRSCICTWQTWSLQLGLLIKWLWKTSKGGVWLVARATDWVIKIKDWNFQPHPLISSRTRRDWRLNSITNSNDLSNLVYKWSLQKP